LQTGLALFVHQRKRTQDGPALAAIVLLVQFRESGVAQMLARLGNGRSLRTRTC
jgi:hypothetical protein